MQETRQNTLVGLFVLIGVVALGALIVLFGHGPRWLVPGDTYALTVHFDRVSGVRDGTLVEVNGNRIGHVQEVRFDKPDDLTSGVVVVLAIQQQYRVPVGSRVETVEAGLLGGGRPPLVIRPGNPADGFLPPDKGELRGETISALNAVVPEELTADVERATKYIGDAAKELTPVLRDLDAILKPRTPREVDATGGPPGNLASAAARLDQLLANANAVVGDPQQQNMIREAIDNVHAMSADGRTMMRNLRTTSESAQAVVQRSEQVVTKIDGAVDQLNARVDDVAQTATTALESAGQTFDYLKISTGRMAQGEGTVGKLLADDRLYESLVLTVRRIGETIEEFRQLVQEWRKGRIRVAL